MADRAHGVANTTATRFAMASGSKGFTALVAVSLIEDGTLSYDTTARSLLGTDLPLIDDAVTVEHLLAHRSGIGDYLDEDAGRRDHRLRHDAARPRAGDHRGVRPRARRLPTSFPPGERFAYNNGGFVVLALLAERAAGLPFHDSCRRGSSTRPG